MTKSLGTKQAWVTLHLPPPETFTLVKTSFPRSKMATLQLGFFSTILIAVKNPAAPPPIISISYLEFIFDPENQKLCHQQAMILQI